MVQEEGLALAEAQTQTPEAEVELEEEIEGLRMDVGEVGTGALES